jgi:hyperosmotically inducible protein
MDKYARTTTEKMESTWHITRRLCTLAAGMVVLGTVGCAGSRYSRSTGEYIDDHSLQLRADHALNQNPDYKFDDISIVAFKGTIQLNGFVDTPEQKTKAGDIAKQVQGVRFVENNVIVENNGQRTAGQAVDDKALATRVRDSLHNNPEYKFDDVGVAAYKGTVQLSGFVDASDQKTKAGDLAKQIPGADNIQNNITAKDAMNQ